MTPQEAVEILKGAIKKPNTKDGYLGQAIDMVIKALEQQSCEDCVSREEVIRIAEQGQIQGYEWQFKKLCTLPSVHPTPKAESEDKE